MAEKTRGEELREQLFMEKKNAYEVTDTEECEKAYTYCEDYKKFLDSAKTEREATAVAVKIAEGCGFEEFTYGKSYKSGDKIYFNNRGKAIYLVVFGSDSLNDGVSIAAAHIDSPRIDLKQNPLYEDGGMAYFKTHYYGGIKKYQWPALPLAIHGVIVKADGEVVNVCVGEADEDPVFCINDLLPHLDRDGGRPVGKAIDAEKMNILVGSRPFDDEKVSDKIKLNVLSILNEKYGIIEKDFLSAELSLVPAGKSRDLGFDRSMIMAYGHDDKVCAYPIITATLEAAKLNPKKTVVTILADKEETGSDGNTGMKSHAFRNMLWDICESAGANYRQMMANSKCLSADVNACFDPNFGEVYESRNSCYINKGVVVTKFTGAGGKSSTNDASAEFCGEVRRIFDKENILWQTAELGKVDVGGGGTVAKYISEMDVDTIDVGVAVLSMHAPFEVVSKMDVYMTHKAFTAFFMR
ncbi:MAG: aminopeptidase [Ruminococcaceae bacterium]|nr:aminopeptidase [Oscillospiraceae bacterium]